MSEDTKWYVLRVFSGKERKIKDYLDMEIEREDWGNAIRQVLVPTEKVYKIRKGKKVIQERNFFPGYILIEASPQGLSGDMIANIRSAPGVMNFLHY